VGENAKNFACLGNLPQELAILTEVHRSAKHPLTLHTEIQYSNEPNRNLLIDTVVTSRSGNYRCDMNMTHQATKLELRQTLEYERTATGRAQLTHFFSHLNTDSELMALEHILTFDQQDKKIIFTASSPAMTLRHVGQLTQSGNNSLLSYEIQQDDGMPRTAEFSFGNHIPYAHFVAQFDPENQKVRNESQLINEFICSIFLLSNVGSPYESRNAGSASSDF
jgi:hypothetical protein